VTVRRTATVTLLQLSGEVDAAVVWEFQARHAAPEPVDVIDTDEVTFLSVHGAELIAEWARASAAAGDAAVLRRPNRHVRRVLELTGLDEELSIPPPRTAPD
jgi:anti-anti-sigma factor